MDIRGSEVTTFKRKRRWFQYSLGTLMTLVTVCALACSWLAVKMRQAERQREAAAAVEKLGGTVEWDSTAPRRPVWLRRLVGDDLFNSVRSVDFSGNELRDAWLEHIKMLSQLRELHLVETNATDADIEQIKSLSQLNVLALDGTQVTDAGLGHVGSLSQLRDLDIGSTQVTDAGVKKLQQALPKLVVFR